jgi:hypothetical protein
MMVLDEFDDWPVAWTPLTFGSSTTLYGTTVYEANETISGAVGQMIQIKGLVYSLDNADGRMGIGDGTNAVFHNIALNNFQQLYRHNSATNTGFSGSIGNGGNSFDGSKWTSLLAMIHSSSSVRLRGGWAPGGTTPTDDLVEYVTTSFLTTLTPWVMTGDISQCALKYRVLS